MGKHITISNFSTPVLLATLVWFLPVALYGQLRVINVTPRQNEINVANNVAVEVTFSEDLNPATLNESTWRVHGNQTGFYRGSITYDAATRTGRFLPSIVFKEGEVVSVTLTSGIQSSSGFALAPAFQFSFTVTVEYGTGVFGEKIEILIGENPDNPTERDPAAIFAGDFDNDFFPDLAVVNGGTNSVTILKNRFFIFGGSFEAEPSVSVGAGPNSVVGGDFDNDSFMDLAVSNFDDNSISLLRNLGDGNFFVSRSLTTAEHPTQVDARDFNNDGLVDLAVTILGINRLQIFMNQGGGNFILTPEIYQTGATPYGFACGDFDNDGDVDIVVTNSGENTIIVYKNDGQAHFTNSGEITVPDFPTKIKANDLIGRSVNDFGDGFLDLVIVHPNINSVTVMDNRSRDGGFVISQQLNVGVRPADVFVADVDTSDATALAAGFGKDHDLDLAVPNLLTQNLYLLRNEFNNGFSGSLSDIYETGETPVSITGSDFDKDGDVDLAVTNLTAHTVSILLNQGGAIGGIRFDQPPQLIDFGQVYVGSDSTRILRLFNPTGENVSLDEISTTLPVFTVPQSQAVIAPGEVFNLAITFTPTDTVVYEDSLTLRATSFGNQETQKVALRGEGIRAVISVVPDTLNFGNILPPQTATLPIQIFNNGNGALIVSDLQFTDPVFSAPLGQLTLPPYSSQQVDITFVPTAQLAYFDTLTIINNDSSNSEYPVILLGGPNQFPPRFTSADTVTAIEDSLFQYTATASDSDGTQPRFMFQNLPSWLNVSSQTPENNSIEGTPREGDLDTSFVVIANDGFYSDTLAVFVDVIPVNDPPVISQITDQTVTELTLLTFNLTATDPEDSTLAFSATGLPAGAVFTDNGNKTATFSWVPPFNSRGVYTVTFVVTEVFEQPALSDTAVVKITVQESLPDLVAASLGVTSTDIALNQTRVITGIVRSDIAPVQSPFKLTFLHDGNVAKDTVITSIDLGEEIAFNYPARFDRLGSHEITFLVDTDGQIDETDEDNNSAVLLLTVSKAHLVVRPNPFTPNSDGFNDEAVFDFSQLVLEQPELKIFNFNGVLLKTLTGVADSRFRWDGRDSDGREQKPGIYLYVLADQTKTVTRGYIALAR